MLVDAMGVWTVEMMVPMTVVLRVERTVDKKALH